MLMECQQPMLVAVTVTPAHFCSRPVIGQVCHGPSLALGDAGSRRGRHPSREEMLKRGPACWGRLGVRGMLQGWSAQKLSLTLPSQTCPGDSAASGEGQPWHGFEPGSFLLPQGGLSLLTHTCSSSHCPGHASPLSPTPNLPSHPPVYQIPARTLLCFYLALSLIPKSSI